MCCAATQHNSARQMCATDGCHLWQTAAVMPTSILALLVYDAPFVSAAAAAVPK
jgi:hypothetical protein